MRSTYRFRLKLASEEAQQLRQAIAKPAAIAAFLDPAQAEWGTRLWRMTRRTPPRDLVIHRQADQWYVTISLEVGEGTAMPSTQDSHDITLDDLRQLAQRQWALTAKTDGFGNQTRTRSRLRALIRKLAHRAGTGPDTSE